MRDNLVDVVIDYLFEEYLESCEVISGFVKDCLFSTHFVECLEVDLSLDLSCEEVEYIENNWEDILEILYTLGNDYECEMMM